MIYVHKNHNSNNYLTCKNKLFKNEVSPMSMMFSENNQLK